MRIGIGRLGENRVHGVVIEDLRRVGLNISTGRVDEVQRGLKAGAQKVRVGPEAAQKVLATPGRRLRLLRWRVYGICPFNGCEPGRGRTGKRARLVIMEVEGRDWRAADQVDPDGPVCMTRGSQLMDEHQGIAPYTKKRVSAV